MFCIHCGKEIADNSEFCSFCGEKCISPGTHQDNISHIEGAFKAQKSRSDHYSEIPCPFCKSINSQPTGNGIWTCLNCGSSFFRKEDVKNRLIVEISLAVKFSITSIILEIISSTFLFSVVVSIFALLFYGCSAVCWFHSRKPVPYYTLQELMEASEIQQWQGKRKLGKILLIAYPVIILILTIIASLR